MGGAPQEGSVTNAENLIGGKREGIRATAETWLVERQAASPRRAFDALERWSAGRYACVSGGTNGLPA
jgi:hypothetical protein